MRAYEVMEKRGKMGVKRRAWGGKIDKRGKKKVCNKEGNL